MAPRFTQRRVTLALLGVQALLAAMLSVYMWSWHDHQRYSVVSALGAFGYALLFLAYRRGWEPARHVTVVLVTVLVVGTLEEPYLTDRLSVSLLLPPTLALLLTSPSWVVGAALFEVFALVLRSGTKSSVLNPISLSLLSLMIAALVVSRKITDAALENAQKARFDAERRAAELLEQRERAEQLELELRHAQRLESLGRLAGGVAHDFNNLLTVISGSAMLAERALPAEHAVTKDLIEIQNASRRAADLTRQLLAFARRQVLQRRTVDLRDLLPGLQRMLGRLLGERITLAIGIPGEALLLNADPGQLEQVVVNLVLNARDAMSDGGTVRVEAQIARLPAEASARLRRSEDEEYIRIDVTDTGSGMSDAVRARVFEPFFTTKELGRGTGLGLATSFGIVKQHGGHLLLDSEPGRGSTFSVYLPRAYGEAADEAESSVRTLPRGRERILLVEDDPNVRSVAARILEDAGYGVDAVGGGNEALSRLDRKSYDVLVSDVVMPGVGGVELAARAKERRPHLGVVLMSGYADALLTPSKAGEQSPEFLQKPFNARALVEAVRRAEITRAAQKATGERG